MAHKPLSVEAFVSKLFPHLKPATGAKVRLATSSESQTPNTWAIDLANGDVEFFHPESDLQTRALKDYAASGTSEIDYFAKPKADETKG